MDWSLLELAIAEKEHMPTQTKESRLVFKEDSGCIKERKSSLKQTSFDPFQT